MNVYIYMHITPPSILVDLVSQIECVGGIVYGLVIYVGGCTRITVLSGYG